MSSPQKTSSGCGILAILFVICVGITLVSQRGSATPTAAPVFVAPAPTAKPDSALTGDDWATFSSSQKATIIGRLLGRVPSCRLAVADGVKALDDVYTAPNEHTQKVIEMFAAWAVLAGCRLG